MTIKAPSVPASVAAKPRGTTMSSTSVWLLMLSGFWLGFFLMGISPIGFQYGAEIAHPTPEGTSNGLIQLFGQASAVFVYVMVALKSLSGTFTTSLLLAVGLLVVSLLVIMQMKDPVYAANQS